MRNENNSMKVCSYIPQCQSVSMDVQGTVGLHFTPETPVHSSIVLTSLRCIKLYYSLIFFTIIYMYSAAIQLSKLDQHTV